MDWGIIGFEIAAILMTVFLIPIGIKIINVLNNVGTTMTSVAKATEDVCNSLCAISKELTKAHLRDKDIENRLSNIENTLQMKCQKNNS